MDDSGFMRRALALARSVEGSVGARPPVGAVVVAPDGSVVGEGATRGPGRHAETAALDAAGDRASGATMYATLEPCAGAGRCAERIVDAGVARVVTTVRDPNPEVHGAGLRQLREAGVEVRTGLGGRVARELIEPFSLWVRAGRPFVTLKLAASLDGKVAAPDGTSRWISGEPARAEVHELRGRVDAVLVGSMTVVRDDPRLTARPLRDGGTQPMRVIVDGSGRTPVDAQVFDDAAPTLVVTTDDQAPEAVAAWERAGATVATVAAGEDGVDIVAVLVELGRRDVCHVLCEGGPTIAASLVAAGLVDRAILYLAPKLIGGDAPGLLNAGVKTLADAWGMRIASVKRVGDDIRLDARPEVA